ncbi:MAG: ThiF family adenylyltransferase [Actinobacteria bacterium]|nr:ThiF family adenylyltransferase [Actinomycetota bacterium]
MRLLERRIRAAQVRLLLVRYARDGEPAVAALVAAIEQGAVKLRAVESADDGAATRRLRAGPGADSLATRRVAVVRIGAVGGFVADLLRSGVGKLTLVDGKRLRPGNCVRHLLGHGYVGWNKAAGVRDDLLRRHDVAPERVAAVERSLSDGEEAETLLTDHDLVVNAAAADLPTGLLFHCAAAIGTTVLSVHLERRGELAVVHRRPLGPACRGTVSSPPVPPER